MNINREIVRFFQNHGSAIAEVLAESVAEAAAEALDEIIEKRRLRKINRRKRGRKND